MTNKTTVGPDKRNLKWGARIVTWVLVGLWLAAGFDDTDWGLFDLIVMAPFILFYIAVVWTFYLSIDKIFAVAAKKHTRSPKAFRLHLLAVVLLWLWALIFLTVFMIIVQMFNPTNDLTLMVANLVLCAAALLGSWVFLYATKNLPKRKKKPSRPKSWTAV